MPSKSGNPALETVENLTRTLVVPFQLTVTLTTGVSAPTFPTAPSEIGAPTFDFVLANGVGTLAPEFTFSGINTTTAPVLGFEILDTEASRLVGGYGFLVSTGTGNAGQASPALFTISPGAGNNVTSGTKGGATAKGTVVGYATLVGSVTTLAAATGTATGVLVVQYI